MRQIENELAAFAAHHVDLRRPGARRLFRQAHHRSIERAVADIAASAKRISTPAAAASGTASSRPTKPNR